MGSFQLNIKRATVSRPTVAYLYQSLKYAIEPPRPFNEPFKHLIGPLNLDVWLAILALLFVSGAVILCLKFLPPAFRRFVIGGYVNRTPIMNMWNSFLGGGVVQWNGQDRRALSTFAKALFVISSLGWLIIRNSYQGSLYDFLRRDDIDNSLDTSKKVHASNCDTHTLSYITSQLVDFGIDPKSGRYASPSVQQGQK